MTEKHDSYPTYVDKKCLQANLNCFKSMFLDKPSSNYEFLVSFMGQMENAVNDVINTDKPNVKITIREIYN